MHASKPNDKFAALIVRQTEKASRQEFGGANLSYVIGAIAFSAITLLLMSDHGSNIIVLVPGALGGGCTIIAILTSQWIRNILIGRMLKRGRLVSDPRISRWKTDSCQSAVGIPTGNIANNGEDMPEATLALITSLGIKPYGNGDLCSMGHSALAEFRYRRLLDMQEILLCGRHAREMAHQLVEHIGIDLLA